MDVTDEKKWLSRAEKVLRRAGWHPGRVAEKDRRMVLGSSGQFPESVFFF